MNKETDTQEKPLQPDQLDRLGEILAGFHRRISALEAALPAGLTQVGTALVVHKNAITALALGVNELIAGTGDTSPLADIRDRLAEVNELEKLHEKEPGTDSL
jgi:hypothetical protein